jgi:hypothetical protein
MSFSPIKTTIFIDFLVFRVFEGFLGIFSKNLKGTKYSSHCGLHFSFSFEIKASKLKEIDVFLATTKMLHFQHAKVSREFFFFFLSM